jgi:hypothetical protein
LLIGAIIIKQKIYNILSYVIFIFFCAMPCGVVLLFYAYYALHQEIADLQAVTAAYRLRVEILNDLIDQQTVSLEQYAQDTVSFSNEVPYECESLSSFTLLNRNLDYLKDSTHRFFKAQKLDNLLTHTDDTVWEQYAGSLTLQKMNRGKQKKGRFLAKHPRRMPFINQQQAALQWPIEIDKFWLSSLYGPRPKRDGSIGFHYGIDMAAIKGTPVMAAASGVVVQAHYAGGLGNAVVIRHSNHLTTRYAHLHTVLVRPGQKVFAGMIIGKVGETGYIRKQTKDGSHLHFELYKYGTRINPLTLLPSIS